MKWFADPEMRPGRDGLNVFNLRAYTAPIKSAPDLSFEFEYASERNADALDSNAWTLQGAYEFSEVAWTPKLTYRYAFFQGDDPDTTPQRSLRSAVPRLQRLGHLVAGGDRRRVLPLQLESGLASGSRALSPTDTIGGGLIFFKFLATSRIGRTGRDGEGPGGRARRLRGLEAEQQFHRQPRWRLRRPRQGAEATGRTETRLGMVYVETASDSVALGHEAPARDRRICRRTHPSTTASAASPFSRAVSCTESLTADARSCSGAPSACHPTGRCTTARSAYRSS